MKAPESSDQESGSLCMSLQKPVLDSEIRQSRMCRIDKGAVEQRAGQIRMHHGAAKHGNRTDLT